MQGKARSTIAKRKKKTFGANMPSNTVASAKDTEQACQANDHGKSRDHGFHCSKA